MAMSGVAHASAAQSLSLKNVPVRAATDAKKANAQGEGISPLFIIGGIVAVVAVLELTGAINIFGDDSDSN
jgi:hypothetical protein